MRPTSDGNLEYLSKPGMVYYRKKGLTLELGKGLPLPAMSLDHQGTRLRMLSEADMGCGSSFKFPVSLDGLSQVFPYPTRVIIYRDGKIDREIPLCFIKGVWSQEKNQILRFIDVPISSGSYTVEVDAPPYLVMDVEGKGVLQLTTLGIGEDRVPPNLASLSLLRNGQPTEEFGGLFSKNEIKLSFEDGSSNLTVQLFQQRNSGEWASLVVSSLGNGSFTATPLTNGSGPQSLKIFAEDETGNSFEYILDPAFLIKSGK